MAKIKNGRLLGQLGEFTYYTMKGVAETLTRTNGGATKDVIKKSPKFKNTRLLNEEWKGCTMMSMNFRRALRSAIELSDANQTGTFNSYFKQVQGRDEISEWGKRAICLSKYRFIFSGFSLNKVNRLETILQLQPSWQINREGATARLAMPEFNPSIQIKNIYNRPFFRLVATLGAVSDIEYMNKVKQYRSTVDLKECDAVYYSEWVSTQCEKLSELNVELKLAKMIIPVPDSVTFFVVYGIQFGTVDAFGRPYATKAESAARILTAE